MGHVFAYISYLQTACLLLRGRRVGNKALQHCRLTGLTEKWAGPLRWLSNDNDPLGAGKETSLADDGVSFFSGKMGAIITLLVAMSYKWPLRSLQTRWRVAQKNSLWKTCAAQLYDSIIFFHFLMQHSFFFFCLCFGIILLLEHGLTALYCPSVMI